MDSGSWLLGLVLLAGVVASAFAAGAEMALSSVSRLQVRGAAEGLGARRAQIAEELLSDPVRFLTTLQILKLTGVVAAVTATVLIAPRQFGPGWLVPLLIVVGLLLIFAQLLARSLVTGRRHASALRVAPVVQTLAILLSPITAIMRRIGQEAVADGATTESIFLSEDGLRFLLSFTDEETVIEDEEKEMIASIFEFGETLVREVMVPRMDVVAVPLDASMNEALDLILKAGHSRIPVYRDSVDNVVGILYAKDLLRYLRDGRTDVPLGKILRTAYFIPESKKVDELLQELQQRRVHMAVVVDEYGGTAGVVTIEDLLEEIVGEIQDEFDAEEPTVEELGESGFLFDARVDLDEVGKLLHLDLPEEGGDTLGGFIYSQLGKVPAVGDRIVYAETVFEVMSVAGRRIKQVRAGRGDDRSVGGAEGVGAGQHDRDGGSPEMEADR